MDHRRSNTELNGSSFDKTYGDSVYVGNEISVIVYNLYKKTFNRTELIAISVKC